MGEWLKESLPADDTNRLGIVNIFFWNFTIHEHQYSACRNVYRQHIELREGEIFRRPHQLSPFANFGQHFAIEKQPRSVGLGDDRLIWSPSLITIDDDLFNKSRCFTVGWQSLVLVSIHTGNSQQQSLDAVVCYCGCQYGGVHNWYTYNSDF